MTTLTHQDLRQFTGTISLTPCAINPRVFYTDGVRYMAEKGEAYWLIDAIAIWMGSKEFKHAANCDDRLNRIVFWTLTVDDDCKATLQVRADGPEPAFIEQVIPFTDFPLKSIDLWVGADEHG